MIPAPMTHNELAADLARHLRGNTGRMVWTDTQLGPAGSPRPDVYSVDKSFSNFKADAYEIKVSVSDFRRDITAGKWQSYRPFAHRVWFAFERGLVPLADVPRECGVIVRGEGGNWRAARKPTAQVIDNLPMKCWMKLLLESNPDPILKPAPRSGNRWQQERLAREKFGSEIADLLANRDRARDRILAETARLDGQAQALKDRQELDRKRWEQDRQREMASLNHEQADLAEALGLPRDCSVLTLTSALGAFEMKLRKGGALDRAIREMQALETMLGRMTKKDEVSHELG